MPQLHCFYSIICGLKYCDIDGISNQESFHTDAFGIKVGAALFGGMEANVNKLRNE